MLETKFHTHTKKATGIAIITKYSHASDVLELAILMYPLAVVDAGETAPGAYFNAALILVFKRRSVSCRQGSKGERSL
jgi:hypothetical protein